MGKLKRLPSQLLHYEDLGLADQILTQRELAERCGTSTRTVRKWQNLGMPSLKYHGRRYYKWFLVAGWIRNYYRLRSGERLGRCQKCEHTAFLTEFEYEHRKE